MQTPLLVFDHVNKVVTMAAAGRDAERKMAELAAASSGQVSGASTSPPRPPGA